MKDKRYRSILKAISWRLTGTLDTFVISFLVTGQFRFAMSISFFEIFTKITLYYLHERLWNRVMTGRSSNIKPDYEI